MQGEAEEFKERDKNEKDGGHGKIKRKRKRRIEKREITIVWKK